MSTCAEGVETKDQLMFLRREGCTEVQGYLYGKPKPANEIKAMLEGMELGSSKSLQKAS